MDHGEVTHLEMCQEAVSTLLSFFIVHSWLVVFTDYNSPNEFVLYRSHMSVQNWPKYGVVQKEEDTGPGH